jgi:hypothetical protein
MIAGALAGSATVLMTNPIWVVNTRMTTRKSEVADETLPGAPTSARKAPSTLGTLFALVRDEGPARLFAGVMPALVLVINPILQYTVFEQLKQMLEKRRRVMPKDAFFLGALGKLLATSITYPYITVKSRMHVAGRDGPREDMLTTFRRIIREEGYMGLYGGTSNRPFLLYGGHGQGCANLRTGRSRCVEIRSHGRVTVLMCRQALDPRSPRVSLPLRSFSRSRMRYTPTPYRRARSSPCAGRRRPQPHPTSVDHNMIKDTQR